MYQAPVKDLQFVLHDVLGSQSLSRFARYAEYSDDLASAVLDEAARFAEQVLAPINQMGDRAGARFDNGSVHLPAEFRRAYQLFVDGGWTQLTADAAQGGQAAPLVLATACDELWFGANIGFMLCPLLGRSAAETLASVASKPLQQLLLPPIVSGAWASTMNLTEAQAGSDLAAIRTRARPDGEHYRVTGQKIFITYGEHDLSENILHLVLARIDGAPPGVKGISLLAVPKRLIRPDGSLGELNDVRCVSIEHKLGMHVSPTCVMSYGDHGGALGYLVGEAHQGLAYMFIMMNAARLAVGVQGIGLAQSALQLASAWAQSRIQGHPIGERSDAPLPIAHHPDVRRMLLSMRATIEAMRCLSLYAALELDCAHAETDVERRAAALARAELLIPIVKGWCTEQAIEMVSLGVQIHGGMGYIEETGIAQILRDVRILSIYEGTTGIQANDLLGRKLGRDRGAAMAALLSDSLRELNDLRGAEAAIRSVRNATIEAVTVLRDATEALLPQLQAAPASAYAVGVPFLQLCGRVLGAVMLARCAGAASRKLEQGSADRDFLRAKLQNARFYAEHLLAQCSSLARIVKSGGGCVAEADPNLL